MEGSKIEKKIIPHERNNIRLGLWYEMDHHRVDCAVRRIIVAVGYLSRGKSSGGTIAGVGCRVQIYIYW